MAASSVSISLLLRVLLPEGAAAAAKSQQREDEEDSLSDWERVYLPIDPGVVLLDIAFVPGDFNHGSYFFLCLLYVYYRFPNQIPISKLVTLLLLLTCLFVLYLLRFCTGDSPNHFGDQRWWKHLGSAFHSLSRRWRFQLQIQFHQLQRKGGMDCWQTCYSFVHFRCRRHLGKDTSKLSTSWWYCNPLLFHFHFHFHDRTIKINTRKIDATFKIKMREY